MTGEYYLLIGALTISFLIFLYFIGRVVENTTLKKGLIADEVPAGNSFIGFSFFVIGFVFLVGTIWSMYEFKGTFLPESASYEGVKIDDMTWSTFVVTFIVFILTHIALFVFAFKYRFAKSRKAEFIPHNTKLEIIWTLVPSVVLATLIGQGIFTWNEIMAPPVKSECVVIEATAKQFGWIFRYPGPDGELGPRRFGLIDDNLSNELGIDLTNPKSHDDLYSSKLMLPKDKEVLMILGSRDVLHSFYLPHFRVKMDCVPGMPTHFNFKPRLTTNEMRAKLGKENFNYELACAEMCGAGHYGMMKEVEVVTQDEFKTWVQKQYDDKKTYKALIEQ